MFRLSVGGGLELRQFEEVHTDELFRVIDHNRAYLREWLPWVDGSRLPSDTRHFIRTAREQFENQDTISSGIWVDGQLAGAIGVHKIDWANRNTSIGYWLDAAQQGRGIMTRACRAMVDHVFREFGLHRLEIRCATGNERSCAIPHRLGFTREGVLRETQWLYDRFVDLVVWSMLDDDWRKRESKC